jgi:hypothetical protein
VVYIDLNMVRADIINHPSQWRRVLRGKTGLQGEI